VSETPNINSPDVFQSLGNGRKEGGGGGGSNPRQYFYSGADVGNTTERYLPLGYNDGDTLSPLVNVRGFAAISGTWKRLVVRVQIPGSYTARVKVNSTTNIIIEQAFTTTTSDEVQSFDYDIAQSIPAIVYFTIDGGGVDAPRNTYICAYIEGT
jgi:hypothetical protein